MSEIPSLSPTGAAASLGPIARAPAREEAAPSRPQRAQDSVEFSPRAQLLSRLAELPDVRQGLIDRVRAEIASGTYETPDKIDALLEDLNQDLSQDLA
jgi:anti-sigma28 factor (negative regulator of flagellin synthesis)